MLRVRRVLQIFKEWFYNFLQVRGMSKANGQMLFRYRATQAEYQELKGIFSDRFKTLGGASWQHESSAESALFVLYSAEWWRREYAGGAWRWTSIFESLTIGTYRVDPLERSVIVELGLSAWLLRPSEDGKKYLGAIVAHGGLPLKLLGRGDGVISRLLLSATRKAQMLGWGEQQLVGYFESYRDDMVQHVRAAEIYRLLSEMVLTVLSLRGEYKLAGVGNPVAVLEQMEPKWRERFPIAVDDQSVDPLLVGLVREVSRQIKTEMAYPVSVLRTLVKQAEADSYALSMSVSLPRTISVEALASALQVAPSKVPQSFALEMAGEQRMSLGQGRQLLGAQSSTVLLSGHPKRFQGKKACQEVLLTLRSVGADVVSPTSVPGGEALDDFAPWVFESVDDTLTLVAVGSCKIASVSAFVLAPDHFRLVPIDDASVELIGLVEELPEPRWMHKVEGRVSIVADDDSYTVQTHSPKGAEEQFVWKGNRLWRHSSPFPVYQGVPRLYRLDEEGQPLPIADKDIEWVQAVRKGERLVNVKAHRGPVDAWLLVDGKRQRRFRMAVVAPDAHIAFRSGDTECEGRVEFHGWGVTALHASSALSPVFARHDAVAKLAMKANGQPPANATLTAEWSPALPVLRIDVPFPAAGGRFARSDGGVLANAATLTLRRAHNVHVQVFDQNPSAPKRYRLELQLSGESKGNRMRRAEIAIPLDGNGVGDLRFFEIESTLNGLFCQSDHLDACLEVSLVAGSATIRTLRINRYDVELEREQQSLALLGSQMADVSVEQLQGLVLHAIPLLESTVEPQVFEQLQSGEQPVGRWSMVDLPAGHSPWLVYPSQMSSLLARPTLWSTSAFDRLGTLQALGDGACPLSRAMSSSTPNDRERDLTKVVADMTEDMDHASWKLVFHHYKHLKHLPLSTLDYWRVIGRSQEACLTAALKFPSDVHELMSRMRDELGVMWEFTSRATLVKAYDRFFASWLKQLGGAGSEGVVEKVMDDLYDKIGSVSEVLAVQIDLVLFEKTGKRTPRFEQSVARFASVPDVLLQQLWLGEDSLLQRVLLRNHADQQVWPYFKLWEELLNAVNEHCELSHIEFIRSLGRKLLWVPQVPPGSPPVFAKFDVANAPLLTGFLVQSCDAGRWLQSSDHMAALRQIKAFDPIWFETGLQMGALLAMKVLQKSTAVRRSR